MTEQKSWDRIRDIREKAKEGHVYGLDGMSRSPEMEKKLNSLAATVLNGRAGEEFLNYLRSITLNNVTGPGMDDAALRHLEGQRYLIGLIVNRLELGKRGDR